MIISIPFQTLITKYKLVTAKGTATSRFLQIYPQFSEEDKRVYAAMLGDSLPEKLYCYFQGISERPTCKQCGATLVFNSQIKKYREFCSTSCRGKYLTSRRELPGAKNPATQRKMQQTNLQRFGVSSFSKTEQFKTRIRKYHKNQLVKTLVLEELQSQLLSYNTVFEVSQWKCKQCNTVFPHTFGFAGFKNIPLCPVCYPAYRGRGKSERTLAAWIASEFPEEEVIYNSRDIIAPQEIDIYFPKRHLAIEFDELFWHSENDGKTGQTKKDRYYHAKKTRACEKLGITLIHIWDNEWKSKTEIIKSLIRSYIGKTQKIYARQCICKPISTNLARLFFNENHIQGFAAGEYKYGLFYNEELVSALIISKRYASSFLEISRFVTKKNYQVLGGFSKLWAYFLSQNISFSEIRSYADLRYFTGKVNSQVGFVLVEVSPPTYFYTKDYFHVYHRTNFTKRNIQKQGLIFDPSLTEWENMQKNKYNRIWDCGKNVWVLHRNEDSQKQPIRNSDTN